MSSTLEGLKMPHIGGGTAELPPVPLLRSLYAEIIRSMNADVAPTTRLHELECTAINMLAHASPRMLLIDEIHNLLSCSARDQRAALNAIKYLANKLRISIVAAGTYEALHVMRSDSQIASRFEQQAGASRRLGQGLLMRPLPPGEERAAARSQRTSHGQLPASPEQLFSLRLGRRRCGRGRGRGKREGDQ